MTGAIFQETAYLTNPSYQRSIEFFGRKMKKKQQIDSITYEDTIQKYHLFVQEIANYLSELGYDSSLDLSLKLSYLISNGYLSFDEIFHDDSLPSKEEISCCLGASIVKGYGCCRNYAKMHQDVFQELKRFSKQLYCYEGVCFAVEGVNHAANHVINLIPYEDIIYGIDLYNRNRLYHFRSPLWLEEVSKKPTFRVRYKPYYEVITGDSSFHDILSNIHGYQEYANKETIDPTFYTELKKKIISQMMDQWDQHHAFYEKTKTLKKEIYEGMPK